MPNDTSTLNGALMELGETMADNLTAMGVTASASDGLTTLAEKILDIPSGGGSCCKIEFSESEYTAIGGSATLEIYLQENYAPKTGATVTVTGSDSSSYTGLTNSQGVASVTVSNISSLTTFTASYSNVSAQCTVDIQSYLFYDDCSSSSRLSEYGSSISLTGGRVSTLTYDSTENAYYFNRRTNGDAFTGFKLPISATDNIRISLKAKLTNTSAYCQLGIWESSSSSVYEFIRIRGDKILDGFKNNTNSSIGSNSNVANFTTDYYTLEISYDGGERTVRVLDSNNTELKVWTVTIQTYTSPELYLAQNNNSDGAYIKEIKVENL